MSSRALVVAAMLVAAGCGGESGHPAGPSSSASSGAGGQGGAGGATSSASGGGASGGSGGAGAHHDNHDFAHAAPIEVGAKPGATGVVAVPGVHDFFVFEAPAGAWLRLFTTGNFTNDPDALDTVLRLYDASMEQVAESDDDEAPFALDAEVLFHVGPAGTYFVEVLDHAEAAGGPPRGDDSFAYDLFVLEVDPSLGGVVIDPEQGDTTGSAAPTDVSIPTAAYDYGEVLGTFDHAGDVDVFSFAFHEAGFVDDLLVHPAGPTGNGSTSSAGMVWVTDLQGSTVLARLDVAATGLRDLSCRGLDAGLLWIARPGGAGANDFYAATLRSTPTDEEQAEIEDPASTGSNDGDASAEGVALADDGAARTASLAMRLSSAADVDCFAFPLAAGDVPSLACRSARWGSGVQGLHVELHDPTGQVMASADETVAADAAPTATAAASGTHVACISKTGQDAEIAGDFVTCTLRVPD